MFRVTEADGKGRDTDLTLALPPGRGKCDRNVGVKDEGAGGFAARFYVVFFGVTLNELEFDYRFIRQIVEIQLAGGEFGFANAEGVVAKQLGGFYVILIHVRPD